MNAESDQKTLSSAFEDIARRNVEDLELHIVFSRGSWSDEGDSLSPFFQEEMRSNNIESVIMTTLDMHRQQFITKPEMKTLYSSENNQINSVNDDLDLCFEDIQLGKMPTKASEAHFAPQFTAEEMELVKAKDPDFYNTCLIGSFILARQFEKVDEILQIPGKKLQNSSH